MAGTIFPGILPPEAAEEYGLGDDADAEDVADIIDSGECPWCGDEFDSVAPHASAAHPNEYEAYKSERED